VVTVIDQTAKYRPRIVEESVSDAPHMIDEAGHVLKRVALINVEIDIGRLTISTDKQ
jgi:hypothetical protein